MKFCMWVRGAARIARQPSKLKVLGSNPSGPAIIGLGLDTVLLGSMELLLGI